MFTKTERKGYVSGKRKNFGIYLELRVKSVTATLTSTLLLVEGRFFRLGLKGLEIKTQVCGVKVGDRTVYFRKYYQEEKSILCSGFPLSI